LKTAPVALGWSILRKKNSFELENFQSLAVSGLARFSIGTTEPK
jgi:hypothetical protein